MHLFGSSYFPVIEPDVKSSPEETDLLNLCSTLLDWHPVGFAG